MNRPHLLFTGRTETSLFTCSTVPATDAIKSSPRMYVPCPLKYFSIILPKIKCQQVQLGEFNNANPSNFHGHKLLIKTKVLLLYYFNSEVHFVISLIILKEPHKIEIRSNFRSRYNQLILGNSSFRYDYFQFLETRGSSNLHRHLQSFD